MSKSFAQLFRASKFATYDPTIKQVYTTHGSAKKIGDWGLKRNLPKAWRSPVITVKAIDTAERQTPFDSALHDVLFLKRWNQNFGNQSEKNWTGFSADRKIDLTELSEEQFQQLLAKAKERQVEFKNRYGKLDNQISAINEFFNLLDTHQLAVKAPPMYRSTRGEKKVVEGRILGRVKFGAHAVGVNGVVSYLAKVSVGRNWQSGNKGDDNEINPFNHEVRQFYVQEAYIDKDGAPRVTLNLFKHNRNQSLSEASNNSNSINMTYFNKVFDSLLRSDVKNNQFNFRNKNNSSASFLRKKDNNNNNNRNQTEDNKKANNKALLSDIFKNENETK
ncbi:hypothetical protein K502DRAFT_115491 [Neoconidiobolus thromboides FSU 785]|nr:hypothetical protein K502DRAFT_115491 [Neoconidiobolus thromboides FSU 785]